MNDSTNRDHFPYVHLKFIKQSNEIGFGEKCRSKVVRTLTNVQPSNTAGFVLTAVTMAFLIKL